MRRIPLLWLLILTILHVTAASATAQSPGQPRRLALLVGINQYGARYTPQLPMAEQWSSLEGSVNDVEMLGAELRQRGFEVLTLLDGQATHAAIVKAFEDQLIAKAQAGRGDVLLFHYSGHGQQVPDDNGVPDEADGYDEALVPFDNLGTRNPANHLRDDELGLLVSRAQAKTSNIVISLDSCHSGTATRGQRKQRGAKATLPPATVRGPTQDGDGGFVQSGDAQSKGYVFLAAVRADQQANEDEEPISHAAMGAYTLLLVQALHEAKPQTTYQELLDRIGVQIVGRVSDQNPQLEGDGQKVLFSGQWKAAGKAFRARPVDADGLLPIEAGTLHGLQEGTELDLRPLGAPETAAIIGHVRIVRADLGLCYGQSTAGPLPAKQLANGSQATETFAQKSPGRLRVRNDGPAQLGAVLAGLAFVSTVTSDGAWDIDIIEKHGQVELLRADGSVLPLPQGPQLPMDAALPSNDPALDKRIGQALAAHHRRLRVLTLDNTDPTTKLDVALTLQRVEAVLEMGTDGRKHPKITKVLGPISKDGSSPLPLGSIVQLSLENRGDRPAFVTILELSTDGSLGVLYPLAGTAGGDNRLKAGEKRTIAVPYRMTPPAGTEIFKAIATEEDIDFAALSFRVRRGLGPNGGPLQQIMADVMSGKRSEPFGYSPDKLWGTDAARLELRASADFDNSSPP